MSKICAGIPGVELLPLPMIQPLVSIVMRGGPAAEAYAMSMAADRTPVVRPCC